MPDETFEGPEQAELDMMNYIEGTRIEYPHLYRASKTPVLRGVFDEECVDMIQRLAFLKGWWAGRQEGHRTTEKAIEDSFASMKRILRGEPHVDQTSENSEQASGPQLPDAGPGPRPER